MNVNNINNEKGDGRVLRGGSWDDYPFILRVAYRSYNTPISSNSYIGFRLVRSTCNP